MVLVDESGFMLQPLVRRTWAPTGQTPVLDQWDRHDRVSVITALTLSPQRRRVRMFFQLLDHNAKAEDFLWFLHGLRRELGRRLHVVWDNLGAHRRTENCLRKLGCPWARFHRLPAYAPELNPVEHVWTTGKWGRLANAPPDGLQQLHDSVHLELYRQATEQQLLQAHFRWAELDLR
ncbi:MAG: transposase [Pirellulaceae bacterium]|nr:transposase [Pirellulaceae bacterium]